MMPESRAKPFALSALVMLAIACALLVNFTACSGGRTDDERAAMKQITKLGGRVNFRTNGLEVDFKNTNITDADLQLLKHLPKLKEIRVGGTRVTEPGLEDLRKTFPELSIRR